jgi:hypothetical protein
VRRPTSSADRRPLRSTRLLALLAALMLVSAACGDGDDAIEIDGAAAPGADGTDTGDEDTGEQDAAGEDATGEDATEDDEPDPEAGDDGTSGLRPSDAARAAIDCDAVAGSSPGATIVFPDSDDPASLEAGPGPATVEVVGCSDTFEANVQYDAFHGQNTVPTLSGFTEGGTLGDWEVFSFEETYWTPGDWTVVVFVNDAESGNRVEYDEVTFTVD